MSAALKRFFVDTLASAMGLGLVTCDDLLVHITTDVLAAHLPRPLWARLFAACLGTPQTDAAAVVETVGLANLCEHVPEPIVWCCVRDAAIRSLGGEVPRPARSVSLAPVAAPVAAAVAAPVAAREPEPSELPAPLTAPPPAVAAPAPAPAPAPVGPSIPAPTVGADEDALGRSRPSPRPAFRQASTGIGSRLGGGARRPQATAGGARPSPAARRGQTEADVDADPEGRGEAWRGGDPQAVDEEQLVDWSAVAPDEGSADPNGGR